MLQIASLLTCGLGASAATWTWQQASGTNSWNAGGNWSPASVASGTDNTADFSTLSVPAAGSTVTLDGNQMIGNLIFGNTNPSSGGGWTITAGSITTSTLTLATSTGSPTITVNNMGTGLVTIAATVGGTNGMIKSGTGTLVLTGNNTLTGATMINAGTLQIGVNDINQMGASNFVLNGGSLVFDRNYNNLSNPAISGTGNLTLLGQGNGYYQFQAGSSYTGTTTVQMSAGGQWYQGTLWLSADNLLPHTTVLQLLTGKVYMRGNNISGETVAGLSGSAGTGIFTDQTGQKFTVNTSPGQTYSFAGTIGSDPGYASSTTGISLTISGSGEEILTGSNSYSGGTTVTGGTLAITGAGTLGSSTATVSGGVLDLGGATVTNGLSLQGGTVQNGVVSQASGNFDIESGKEAATASLTGSAGLNKPASTGIAILAGSNSYSGGTTISSGTLQIQNAYALGSSTGNLAVNGGTLDLNGYGETVGLLTGSSGGVITTSSNGSITLTVNSPNSGTYGGIIQNGSGAIALTKSGTGTEILTGNNTYTGTTTVNGGTLQIANNAFASWSTTNVVLNNGAQLAMYENGNLDLPYISGTGNVTLLGEAGGYYRLGVIADSITISGTITLNFATRTQWYNGGLFLQGGSNLLTANSVLQILSGNLYARTATATIAGLTGSAGTDIYHDNGGTTTLAIDPATGQSYTYPGNIGLLNPGDSGADNNIALVISGTGAQILTGSNAYNGGTTVNSGTLGISGAGTLGSSTVTISGGFLDLGGGTLTNTISLKGGTLQDGTATQASGNFDIESGQEALTASLTGSAGVSKTTAGTAILSGNNSYSGGTTISAGILEFEQTTAMPATGTVSTGSLGTLAVNVGGAGEFTNAATGNGSLGAVLSGTGGQGAPITFTSGGALAIDTSNAGGSFTYSPNFNVSGYTLDKIGTGNLTLSGSNAITSNPVYVLNGSLTITGITNAGSVLVGNNAATTGTLNITGGTLTTSTNVGDNGSGLSVANGTLNVTGGGTLTIGNGYDLDIGASNGPSYLNVNGGTINGTKMNVGWNHTGIVTLTSGTIYMPGGMYHSGPGSGSAIDLNGGVLITVGVSNFASTTDYTLAFNGGTLEPSTYTRLLDNFGNSVTAPLIVTLGSNGGTINTNGFNAVSVQPFTNASGVTATTLTKSGAGTFSMGNVSTYSGTTNVIGGTLSADYSLIATGTGAALPSVLPASSVITLANGADFEVNGRPNATGTTSSWTTIANSQELVAANGSTTSQMAVGQPISGVDIPAGAYVSEIVNNVEIFINTYATSATTASMTFGSAAFNSVNQTVSSIILTAGTGTITLNTNGGSGVGLTVTNGISGPGALQYVSNTVVPLSGSNSYSGGTVISSGTAQLVNAHSLGTGPLAVTGGVFDLNGINLTVPGLSGAGAGVITTSSNANLTLTVNGGGGGVFNGTIQNGAGTVGLTKSGTGTLTLGGINSYTGSTLINGGVLALSTAAALSTNTQITFGGGTLQYIGNSTDYSNQIVSSGSAVSIDTGNQGIEFYSQLAASNTGGLTVLSSSGNGTLILTGPQVYTGPTTITSGALYLGDNTGGDDVTTMATSGLIDNGSLVFENVGTLTNTLAISGSGSVAMSGNGEEILSSSNSYTGGTIINSGSLQIHNAYELGSSSGNLTVNGGTLDLDGYSPTVGLLSGAGGVITTSSNTSITLTTNSPNSGTYAGVIQNGSGTVALTKSGSGTLILTGSNSYTGVTTVAGGTLQLGNNSLPYSATSGFVLNNGAQLTMYSNTGFLDLLPISGTGNVTLLGESTGYYRMGNLPSIFTYTGTTTLQLSVGSAWYNGNLFLQNINNVLPTTTVLQLLSGNLIPRISFLTVAGLTGSAGANIYNDTGVTPTLTINPAAGQSYSYAGSIGLLNPGDPTPNNNIALVISGAGTEILTGSNGYAGGTTVNSGTLGITGAGTIGTGTATLNGGALDLGGGTISNAISLRGGTLQDGTATQASGNFDIESGMEALNASLTGSAGVSKTTTGTAILMGSNNYSGGTTINAGTLQFGQTNAMPAIGTISTGSLGILVVNAGGAGEFTNAASGNGSLGALLSGTGGQGAPVTFASGATLGIDTTDAGGSLTYAPNFSISGFNLDKLGTGNLTFSGSDSINSAALYVLNGSLTVTGTSNLGSLLVGNNATTTGTLNIAGGTVTTSLKVADAASGASAANGTINVTAGGTLTIGNNGALTLGESNGPAYLNVNGGTINGTEINVGWNHTGVLTLTSGTISAPSGLYHTGGGTGNAINLNGGVLITGQIGNYGSSTDFTLALNGGTLQNSSFGGRLTDITGFGLAPLIVTIGSNGGTINTNGNPGSTMIPFANAAGVTSTTLTKTGAGTLSLGNVSTYTGTTSVMGGTLSADYSLVGTGTGAALPSVIPSNSVITLAANTGFEVNGRPNATGTTSSWTTLSSGNPQQYLTANGGNTSQLVVGEPISGPGIPAGAYVMEVLDGTHIYISADATTATTSTMTFGSATFSPVTQTIASLNLTSGTGTVTVNNNGGSGTALAVTNGVSGSGALQLSGNGVLTLNGSSGYTGATIVNGGTLIVSGSLSGTPTVAVAAGATLEVDGYLNNTATTTLTGSNAVLRGTGSMDPIVANGGTIAPGLTAANTTTAQGVLTAAGPITLSGSTNFAIRMGLTSGTSTDELAVNTGSVSLNGAQLQLTIGSFMNNPALVGTAYYVIINGGAGGTGTGGNIFAGLAEGSTITTPSGFQFTIDYASSPTGGALASGNDVVLQLTAIPEPGAWGMMIAGLGLLMGLQKMRRRIR